MAPPKGIAPLRRPHRADKNYILHVHWGICGSLSRRGGKCFQRSHFIFRPFDSFGFKLRKKATRLLRVVFMAPPKGIAPLRRPHRADKNYILHVHWGICGSLSRRGGKCFQRSHFIFHPFDSFGFKLIKKTTRLLRVVFLWHHQRESNPCFRRERPTS